MQSFSQRAGRSGMQGFKLVGQAAQPLKSLFIGQPVRQVHLGFEVSPLGQGKVFEHVPDLVNAAPLNLSQGKAVSDSSRQCLGSVEDEQDGKTRVKPSFDHRVKQRACGGRVLLRAFLKAQNPLVSVLIDPHGSQNHALADMNPVDQDRKPALLDS